MSEAMNYCILSICLLSLPEIKDNLSLHFNTKKLPFWQLFRYDCKFTFIDQKGLTDVECYKRANVDKKTFSKIKCNKDYKPSKVTAVSFAIALRLSLEETAHLLRTVGMSLSRSNKFDIIIEYFLTTGNYKSIQDVNETLYQFDQILLGC